MLNKLRYILLTILLIAASQAAGQYIISRVAVGSVKYYRVDGEPGSSYIWKLTDPLGTTVTLPSTADTVAITWNVVPGIYKLSTIQHSVITNCDGLLEIGDVEVFDQIIPNFAAIGPLCLNSPAPPLPDISTNGITGTWIPDTIITSSVGTTAYVFTPDSGQSAIAISLDITIVTEIIPAFASVGPFCLNSTAPALAATSTNGITGTWAPPTISTDTIGTTTYTFTPDSGQCAITTTLDITIATEITPAFAAVGPFCLNSTASLLPVVSTNGITGIWIPATISTDTVGIDLYTFTPDSGQCAIATTLYITITEEITPAFAAVGPLCLNSTAPALASTSTNGITGAWIPATISTGTVGTALYTFTPDSGQCAIAVTLNITITAEITPAFAAVGQLCLNSTAPLLPTVSTNGITGTWVPATVSTGTVGTTLYTFTPASGQCAIVITLDITIATEIIPAFAAIGPLCLNSTAPPLPGISTNSITGTWVPATISTGMVGTTFYTFTPDSGQCAVVVTMGIEVTDQITPTFSSLGPLCFNSTASALPAISTNGISGTWVLAAITTGTVGITNYTFTPDPGQCAIVVTIGVEVSSEIIPAFTALGPLCLNSNSSALPTTSTNGLTGTWVLSSITTSTVGITNYTFTPNPGQCGVVITMGIDVSDEIIPAFASIGPLCLNGIAPALPAISTNGITGKWIPATISTATVGTTIYRFTADAGQCGIPTTLRINVAAAIPPAITINGNPATICAGTTMNFTSSVAGEGATPAYEWLVNGLPVGTNSPTYSSNTLANNDVVSCILTSSQECASQATATSNDIIVIVMPAIIPTIVITGSPTTICAGTSVNFTTTVTGQGPTPTYQWLVNGLPVGTNNPTYSSNTLANGDVISCILTSSEACASPATDTSNNVTITITAPVVPTISIAADLNPICARTLVTFTATITNQGPDPVYMWFKNGIHVGNNLPEYADSTLVDKDVISCSIISILRDAGPVTIKSAEIKMAVYVTIAGFTLTDNSRNINGNILFTNTSTGADTYYWDFGDGQTSNEVNPFVNYTKDGTYLIILTAMNELKCADTFSYKYDMLFKGLFIPNAFAPNATTTLGSVFQPSGISLKKYKIEVYDNWGHLIWESSALDSNGTPTESWDGTYHGKPMPQGTYLWKVHAIFYDDTIWHGSDNGAGKGSEIGTVLLIR